MKKVIIIVVSIIVSLLVIGFIIYYNSSSFIKLNGESKDIVLDNISKLKEIFPDVFNEDKIDFDKLKLDLGEYIDDSHENIVII